jgi:hypothetical protein
VFRDGTAFFRTNSTVVTFGSGDMTADFTCRPLSTITKLCTMGGTGTGGCHCIVPVQLVGVDLVRAEDSVHSHFTPEFCYALGCPHDDAVELADAA